MFKIINNFVEIELFFIHFVCRLFFYFICLFINFYVLMFIYLFIFFFFCIEGDTFILLLLDATFFSLPVLILYLHISRFFLNIALYIDN